MIVFTPVLSISGYLDSEIFRYWNKMPCNENGNNPFQLPPILCNANEKGAERPLHLTITNRYSVLNSDWQAYPLAEWDNNSFCYPRFVEFGFARSVRQTYHLTTAAR